MIDVKSYPGIRADSRGWGPGWPTDRIDDITPVVVGDVSFGKGAHKDIADLLRMLLEESVDAGLIELHTPDCGGFFCRPIKVFRHGVAVIPELGDADAVPSNHSWGLALDINSATNPYEEVNPTQPTGRFAVTRPMANLWNDFGFRWGGDYPHTKDWMHFEFMGTPDDAARLTEKASKEGLGMALTKEDRETLEQARAFLEELKTKLGKKEDPNVPASPQGAGARIAATVRRSENAP